ncbi:6784_t:CDS:1, partial [Funneliformis geosporum]
KVSDSEEINNQGKNNFNKEKELKNNNEIVKPIKEYELQWNNLIYEWINAIQKENQFDNNDDENFLNRKWDIDFRVGERQIHPADDPKAK